MSAYTAFGLVIVLHLFTGSPALKNGTVITVTPVSQVAQEYEDVTIDCNVYPEGTVLWRRKNNAYLPKTAFQYQKRLNFKRIELYDSGMYECICTDCLFKIKATAQVTVERATTKGFSPWHYKTFTQLTTKTFLTTPTTNRYTFSSDFGEYWLPKIIVLPKRNVEVFCGDQDEDKTSQLTLECEFVGHPTPQIKWKKYKDHIPPKCQQSSKDGRGVLICPYFKQSDQGSYSCVAENVHGSSESQPKSIARCSNSIRCKGFKVVSEDQIETCLECYCSGKTKSCQSIKSVVSVNKISFTKTKAKLFAVNDGEIVFVPSENNALPTFKIRESAKEITYYSLPKEELKSISFLKSYGRNLYIPKPRAKANFLTKAPDLIIRGNGISLTYKFNFISLYAKVVEVRFWVGNWHHLNGDAATRHDLMKVLSAVDGLFIRSEYKKGEFWEWSEKANISLETATVSDFSNSTSYLEKCDCPTGYQGLSCETCAPGYVNKSVGNDFICKAKKVCDEGYIGEECTECDRTKNYFKSGEKCVRATCHSKGSISTYPNLLGKCSCKKNVIADSCDQCSEGFFNVMEGCLECWCSGVTKICNSSNWQKTTITSNTFPGGYNSSDGRNFWLLPTVFSGNLLTSYMGYLNYTVTYFSYVPKQTNYLTVEFLSTSDIAIYFKHPDIDRSTQDKEKSWSVYLMEKYWRNSNNQTVTRAEFLSVISKVKAVYIETPYPFSANLVNLTYARMSSAVPFSKNTESPALSVEQCKCPEGHAGLSCETCSLGYYKVKNNSITRCVKCECDNCDVERGCLDCPKGKYRDNPIKDLDPICKPCPCNEHEKSCYKDDYDQVFCDCLSGFIGKRCETPIPRSNESHITVRISPSTVRGQKVKTSAKFNCSYESDQKLKILVKKTFITRPQVLVDVPEDKAVHKSISSVKVFEIILEDDLKYVECFVVNTDNQEVGHVKAVINNLITVVKPVKIVNCYSHRIDLLENDEKDLICEATGSPTPKISWFKSTAKSKMENLVTVDGVHVIKSSDSTMENNGTVYSCMAENLEGDRDFCTQVLIVRRKCDIIRVEPKMVNVEEGKNITLHCKTTAKNKVSWKRNSSALPLGRHKISNNVLEIWKASIEDSGVYVCWVETKNGVIESNATVVVKEKKIAPEVSIVENDQKLKVGDNFKVTCLGTGKPIPKLTWIRVNDRLPSNAKITNGRLEIQSVSLRDSGLYACKGESSLGNAKAFIYLQVEDNRVKPKVEINFRKFMEVPERESVTLSCNLIEGFPEPTFEWSKENNGRWIKIQENKFLKFNNISRDANGTYRCLARNSVGEDQATIQVSVLIAPKTNISNESIIVQPNDNVNLECLAWGNPKPTLTIYPENLKNYTSIFTPTSTEVRAKISFKMSYMKDLDEVKVICVAENSLGKTNSSSKVKVFQSIGGGPSEIVENVPLGTYFELLCSTPDNNVTWGKDNGSLPDNICPFQNGLMILSVQVQHRGKYVCKSGSNILKIINLNVVGFVPKFEKRRGSYLILNVDTDSSAISQIQISFKTTADDGFLLEKQNRKSQEFGLYLKNRKIYFYLGRSINIKCNKSIELNVWYTVTVNLYPSRIEITTYNDKSIMVNKNLEMISFEDKFYPKGVFYLGSRNLRYNFNDYFRKSVFSDVPSLDGCISRLIINHHEFDIVKNGTFSHNATLCKTCSEEPNPCLGKGKCFDAPTQYGFICVCSTEKEPKTCPSGCVGKGCETQMDLCKLINPCRRNDVHLCVNNLSSLGCNCAFGYTGSTCEKVEKTSFCASGNGFIKLPSSLLERDLNTAEIIKMTFTLKKPNGTLLWQGDEKNHLLIAVHQARLLYLYSSQGVDLLVTADTATPVNKKLTLTVTRKNNTAVLEVNRSTQAYKVENSTIFVTNRVEGDIYLGKSSNKSGRFSTQYPGLDGCIHSVAFGSSPAINLIDAMVDGMNIEQTMHSEEEDDDEDDGDDDEDDDDDDDDKNSYDDDD